MVKRFLALLLVAGVAGTLLGYVTGARTSEEHFGHFSNRGELRPEDLLAHMEQLQQDGLPRVEVVGGEIHDFGTMVRHEEGEHRFTLKNAGDAPLQLEVLSTTCKCTVGELEQDSIQPGESTDVHMVWTAKTDGSRFEQTATIATTDPYKGELQLRITGEVVDRLTLSPGVWNAGQVSAGSSFEMVSTLYSRLPYDIRLKEARWLENFPDVAPLLEVQPAAVDGQQAGDEEQAGDGDVEIRQAFQIKARVPAGMAAGMLNYAAQIDFEPVDAAQEVSEDADDLRKIIRMEGRIVSDITLQGGSQLQGREDGRFVWEMPPVPVGQGAEDNLLVFVRGPHRNSATLSIGEIEPDSVLEAELGEARVKEALVVYPLKIKIRQDAPQMERGGNQKDDYGTIWIRSDNDAMAPLRLRVKFSVHEP